MPIDPNLALQARGVDLPNPLEAQAKLLQLRQLAGAGESQDLQLQQQRQAQTDDVAMRRIFSENDDPKQQLANLRKISPKAALAFEKARIDMDKDASATEKTKVETEKDRQANMNGRLSQARDLLGNVNDRNQAIQWVQGLYADKEIGKFLTEHVGPFEQAVARIPDDATNSKEFADWRRASQLNAEKLVEATKPKLETQNLGGTIRTIVRDPFTGAVKQNDSTNITQSPDNIATTSATRRGQDQPIYDPERGVLIDKRTGAAKSISLDGKPIPGGKPLTEFQGKSAAFADRAMAADKILKEIGTDYSSAGINTKQAAGQVWGVGGALETAGNMMLSSKSQRVEQAQRDFVNAVLRQESGASVSQSEFENARKQYFAQPGDNPAVIQQKAKNRQMAIKGFVRSAGSNAGLESPAAELPIPAVPKPAAPAPSGLPPGWSVEVH